MDDPALGADPDDEDRLETLIALAQGVVTHQQDDPFGNPVLQVALLVSRRLDEGILDLDDMDRLVRRLRDEAFRQRAARLRAYVGMPDGSSQEEGADIRQRLGQIAARLVRPDPEDSPVPLAQFRAAIQRVRAAAVFTAHPTFALPGEAYRALAAAASGAAALPDLASQRPPVPSLEDEFLYAAGAIQRGRDAIDMLNAALLREAARTWPQAWTTLTPCPVVLASWVGYDTDGRTDIGWWDTLRLRLRMKLLQLERLQSQLATLEAPPSVLTDRLAVATETVRSQVEAAPRSPDPHAVAAFSAALIDHKEAAILSPAALEAGFAAAMPRAAPRRRTGWRWPWPAPGSCRTAWALAHTHVRLNATQLHNVARQRLGIAGQPGEPGAAAGAARRRLTRRCRHRAGGARSISARCCPSRPRRRG